MPKSSENNSSYLPDLFLVDSSGIEINEENSELVSQTKNNQLGELNSLDYLESVNWITNKESHVEEINETILSNAVMHSYAKVGFGPLSDQLQTYLA